MHEIKFLVSQYSISRKKFTLDQKITLGKSFLGYMGLSDPDPDINISPIVDIKDFTDKVQPKNKIIKMIKAGYKKDFKENGNLQLGSFLYYQKHDNPEIGDPSEAKFVLIGEKDDLTIVANVGGGYNCRLFCCYDGDPNEDIIKKFEYDDSFIIRDPENFLLAISKTINSIYHKRAKCIYAQYKIIQGPLPGNFNPSRIDLSVLEIVNEYKYFVKTSQFSPQNEYRFIWFISDEVTDAKVINCPEARQYCEF